MPSSCHWKSPQAPSSPPYQRAPPRRHKTDLDTQNRQRNRERTRERRREGMDLLLDPREYSRLGFPTFQCDGASSVLLHKNLEGIVITVEAASSDQEQASNLQLQQKDLRARISIQKRSKRRSWQKRRCHSNIHRERERELTKLHELLNATENQNLLQKNKTKQNKNSCKQTKQYQRHDDELTGILQNTVFPGCNKWASCENTKR